MASIVRWLFVAQMVSDLQLEQVLFVDCDVIVYSDFGALFASHPMMSQAHLAITTRNGAISVWRPEAIASFAAFLMRLVDSCSQHTLSKQWSVDMSIIGAWEGYATDIRGLDNVPSPICNGSFHVRLPRLRAINLDALKGGEGWRLAPHWPVPLEWRFGAGNVGFTCPPPPKGCSASLRTMNPPVNCSSSSILRGFHARVAPLAHPTKGPQMVNEMYRLNTPEGGALCTPFVRDVCGLLAPFHAVHYTGRFKYYMPIGGRAGGSSCTCVRSWTRWDTPYNRNRTVLISHPSTQQPAGSHRSPGSPRGPRLARATGPGGKKAAGSAFNSTRGRSSFASSIRSVVQRLG